MTVKQLSVFVENRPGRLAEAIGLMAEHKIDIRALSLADTEDYGILRLIVSKPEAACDALKAADWKAKLTDVVAVAVDDQPGGFYKALLCLHEEGIDVEYTYAFITREQGRACVILRVQDTDRAVDVLGKGGITTLGPDALYGM